MIGATVSHYKILEKLGEGGMGVVYKAQDLKLDRLVALKFLPPYLGHSEEERTRFILEAKTASTLDHPSICTIYEVDQTPDGPEGTGQIFIAMAYYEGTLLTRQIERGPLKISEAVRIAIQVAEGLQAAHGKNIIHRDIKSGNIILTEQGQVKILDFGLARRMDRTKLTKTGTTVGTAAYMSPEQAMGGIVDHRSDLWSLGVVLYEMLTGKLPFRGEHEAAVMYSIVNEEPQPIKELVSKASPELIHIVQRALEKDPSDRYQSAADFLIDLRRLKKETSRVGFTPVSGRSVPTIKRNAWIGVASLLFLVLIGIGYSVFNRSSFDLNPNMTMRQLQIPFTSISYPGISGDGNWIAFGATDQQRQIGLYFMNATKGEPKLVARLNRRNWVDLSNDGSLIVYNDLNLSTGRFAMYMVSSLGGEPFKILDEGALPRFTPDSKRIGYLVYPDFMFSPSKSGRRELWSVGTDGTDARLEFVDSTGSVVGANGFSYSPDGTQIAWIRTIPDVFPKSYEEIFVADLASKEEKQITFEKVSIVEIVWTREDAILFVAHKSQAYNVWLVSSHGGSPIQITKSGIDDQGVKASADGQRILSYQSESVSDLWLSDLQQSTEQRLTEPEMAAASATFSRDERSIAFYVKAVSTYPRGAANIFTMDLQTKQRRQVTFGQALATNPRFSPDGKWIAYANRPIVRSLDSLECRVVEVANPSNNFRVGRGVPSAWIDTRSLVALDNSQSLRTFIDGRSQERFFIDSVFAFPGASGNYILYLDLRSGRIGRWIYTLETPLTEPGSQSFKGKSQLIQLLPRRPELFPATWGEITILNTGKWRRATRWGSFFLERGEHGEIWEVSLPLLKRKRFKWRLPEIVGLGELSADGRYLLHDKEQARGKIHLIENLFK